MMKLFVILFLTATIMYGEVPLQNGKFPEIKYEGKGHFYLQKHEGRYLFITPKGEGFYPIGINHLNVLFNKGVQGKSEVAVKKDLLDNMVNWGFNCGGYGTGPQLIKDGMYYIGSLNIAKQGFYHLEHAQFPDVFSDSFATSLENNFKKTAQWTYKPDRLMGMVWTDLPAWNLHKSRMLRNTDWVSQIRLLGVEADGKKAYVSFLKQRYEGNMEKLKEYYSLSDDNLRALEEYDFSILYLGHPTIIKDDEVFMVEIAKKYYHLGNQFHDQYFPNIPLLGDRFLLGDHPDAILKVAAKYVDAISVQIGDGYGESMPSSYPYPKDTMDHIHALTGKPVLIADHQISFYTKDYKYTTFSQAGSESDASLETMKFLHESYSSQYICGYFRCTYLSQHEPHGRGVKQGVVDFKQNPYSKMAHAYSCFNNEIEKYIEGEK
ncbi:MAG: hypothetical protein HQL32_14600 [Planctomycetes bacterium]|nr:hypothetical protein [Planctomycetota bacterium]